VSRLSAVAARVRAEKQERELREIFSPHPPRDEEGEWNLSVLTGEQLARALTYVTKLTGTKLPPKQEAPPVRPRKARPEPRKQRPPAAPPKAREVQKRPHVSPEGPPPQPRPSLTVISGGKGERFHRVRLSDRTGREWLNAKSRQMLENDLRHRDL
jgi:hypothetical protein